MDFSVSMCVYGRDNPEWFKLAVNSVVNQTLKPNEIIIVVDGSVPDELNDAISEFEKFDYIKCIRLNENMGHGEARRIGLEACNNELVAIMDADDISVPDRFEKQISVFEKDGEIDVVGGQICEFSGDIGDMVGKRIVPENDSEIKEYMKKRCPMNLVTVMFKKQSVLKVGGFVDFYCEEDYYLWVRMALNGMKFANCGDILVNVRVGKDMYKRRGGLKYFISEAKLQKFMLTNGVIGVLTYLFNISKRFIVQVLMPNKVRGWIFKNFARD